MKVCELKSNCSCVKDLKCSPLRSVGVEVQSCIKQKIASFKKSSSNLTKSKCTYIPPLSSLVSSRCSEFLHLLIILPRCFILHKKILQKKWVSFSNTRGEKLLRTFTLKNSIEVLILYTWGFTFSTFSHQQFQKQI